MATDQINNKTEPSKWLFWTCFIALVATSFGFIIRNQIISDLQEYFLLSETQKGEILGVGLWPFAISIVLFSLIIDKIGYGRALRGAFICHIASVVITILAPRGAAGYWWLYIGTFILALGNGIVEAVINPVVATVYSKEKTKWLNILHAGWPGGMVLGGLVILILIPNLFWKWKVLLLILPAGLYGYMMLKTKFPVQERVKAGVPFKEMLQEAGIIGAAIVIFIMMREIGRVFGFSLTLQILISLIFIITYGMYVRAWGRPLFIILLLIIMPLAITELGVDSWITDLMKSIMGGASAGYIIVVTAFIMMVLRFYSGPAIKWLKPLGLLATCSAIAIFGLFLLATVPIGGWVFLAAAIYAVGKTFLWPTMLGVVAERFPKGGALTLNTISGVGMLTVGVIGTAFFGNIVDKPVEAELKAYHPEIHQKVIVEEKKSVFGTYRPIDQIAYAEHLDESEQKTVDSIKRLVQQKALMTVAIFPMIIFIAFIILIFYFRSRGGYQAVELEASAVEDRGKDISTTDFKASAVEDRGKDAGL
ncbi:MFS transporter [candidate division KSB1 bacterium]|nr:MFS transporter [candidate division KSB1 bacterium]